MRRSQNSIPPNERICPLDSRRRHRSTNSIRHNLPYSHNRPHNPHPRSQTKGFYPSQRLMQFDVLSTQTQQTIRLLEVLTHPSASSLSYLASTHGAGGDSLIDFFLLKTGDWQHKVESFKREIAEIDRMLKGVEDGQTGGLGSANDEVLETIRAQWEGFCGMAARVGKLREWAVEVKSVAERRLRAGRV